MINALMANYKKHTSKLLVYLNEQCRERGNLNTGMTHIVIVNYHKGAIIATLEKS